MRRRRRTSCSRPDLVEAGQSCGARSPDGDLWPFSPLFEELGPDDLGPDDLELTQSPGDRLPYLPMPKKSVSPRHRTGYFKMSMDKFTLSVWMLFLLSVLILLAGGVLYGLSSLLLLYLVVLVLLPLPVALLALRRLKFLGDKSLFSQRPLRKKRNRRLMSLGDKIYQVFRLLFWWPLRKKGKCRKKKRLLTARKKEAKKRESSLLGLLWPGLYGMESYVIEVVEFLECGTFSLLGICGMRGVGKSTLLYLVRAYYTDHPSFDYFFHLVAGPGNAAGKLHDVLARRVGIGPIPANKISKFFKNKTFLLLIDDLHHSFDLASAGLPMPLGPGQKVIFTTRSQSVCDKMGCLSNTLQMRCLSEDVAWDLFRFNVGDEIIDADSEIKDIAKQMVAVCRGFPDALCNVGRTMSLLRDVKEWRVAYQFLTKKPPNEVQDMADEGYPCLQFFEDQF